MFQRLRHHLPLVVTALAVGVVASSGPVAARAVYDAMNAHKVDGFHAVGGGATMSSRAGKLVATKSTGRLPNNIIRKAPNSAKFRNLPASAFASKILYSDGFSFAVNDFGYCPTPTFTPTRRSYALVQVDTEVNGDSGGGYFALAAAYNVDGRGLTYNLAWPRRYTTTSAAEGQYAAQSNSGVVPLAVGKTYRFAGTGYSLNGSVSGTGCKVIVQIMPRLPGSSITHFKPRAGLDGRSNVN